MKGQNELFGGTITIKRSAQRGGDGDAQFCVDPVQRHTLISGKSVHAQKPLFVQAKGFRL